jgi:hypothetical protein
MRNNKIEQYTNRINQIKKEIQTVREMRPGSLTQQIFKRGNYTRPFWQISYTLNRKSKTEYVRDDALKKLQGEIAEYQKFKNLTAEWVELAISLSKEQIKLKNTKNPA